MTLIRFIELRGRQPGVRVTIELVRSTWGPSSWSSATLESYLGGVRVIGDALKDVDAIDYVNELESRPRPAAAPAKPPDAQVSSVCG